MFVLRFFAQFIEKNLKISPLGLLLICAILGFIGLNLVSAVTTAFGRRCRCDGVRGGKTFFWPTMLAGRFDRFPKGGAIAMSCWAASA